MSLFLHSTMCHSALLAFFVFFFFNDTATTEIYTLSLHDALPIWAVVHEKKQPQRTLESIEPICIRTISRASRQFELADRKSTRLNSSHANISYAVFCLKKKKTAD